MTLRWEIGVGDGCLDGNEWGLKKLLIVVSCRSS